MRPSGQDAAPAEELVSNACKQLVYVFLWRISAGVLLLMNRAAF